MVLLYHLTTYDLCQRSLILSAFRKHFLDFFKSVEVKDVIINDVFDFNGLGKIKKVLMTSLTSTDLEKSKKYFLNTESMRDLWHTYN